MHTHAYVVREFMYNFHFCTFNTVTICWIVEFIDFNRGTNSNKGGVANSLFIVAVEVQICFLRPCVGDCIIQKLHSLVVNHNLVTGSEIKSFA